MKKNLKKSALKKSASAILLSFFLMSILVVLGIGIASIVLKDLFAVGTLLNGYKALYASEGMTELGLKIIKDKLPGYEEEILDNSFSNSVTADLKISALEDELPCEDQGSKNPDGEDSLWRSLSFNESIQIPLFYQAADGTVTDLEEFIVDFYMPREDGTNPVGDILRWKILGLNNSNATEAISEYISIDGTKNSAANPSIFGASLDLSLAGDYFYANYYRPISSKAYSFEKAYSISSFLKEHKYNYLIITNVTQLSSQGLNSAEEDNKISIKYKPSGVKQAVCEYVKLESSSAYLDVIQKIRTFVKEGENLPVFDFALYHTSGEQEKIDLGKHEIDFDPFSN